MFPQQPPVLVVVVAAVGEGHVGSPYTPDDHQRLIVLKATYDPRNTFRLNCNIPPVTGA
ncbi:BBE domain-containing protein [Streptomyces sp. NPDC000931]|uniref:BBE domain-containing protein n=1 Tax=Streptomyces sp. NPDC000931 TaxID=3154372 RepID=UPI003331813B